MPQSSKDNEKQGLGDKFIDTEGGHSEHEKTLIGELRESVAGRLAFQEMLQVVL